MADGHNVRVVHRPAETQPAFLWRGCTRIRPQSQPIFVAAKAITEYVWMLITWLILALCVAAAVDRLLAAGARDLCLGLRCRRRHWATAACLPTATNKCIGLQPAVDAIRTSLNCGYSP